MLGKQMKYFIMALWISLLTNCVTGSKAIGELFVAAPSSLDDRLDTASIEDYIIALPPYAFHEESVDSFVDNVKRSRGEADKSRGSDPNFLFVGGDGCWPSKDFTLDRKTRTLHVRIYNWEPPWENTISILTMRRVPGGWLRSPQTDIPKEQLEAEQAVHGNTH
jgi:hypothetical protein